MNIQKGLFILLLSLLTPTWARSMNGKVISGIYSQELSPPLFYESYIPVILEYKTPKWNKTDVTFNNWYNCTGERVPYVLSCPISFHLNNAIQNLHTDFESLQPGKDEAGQLNSDYYDRLTSQPSFCDLIQAHFNGMYTHSLDFEAYLDSLEKCSSARSLTTRSFILERNISDFVYSVRARYSSIESNFYDSFYRPVSTGATEVNGTLTKLLASAALSNSRTAIQGSLLGHFYAERNRWTHAVSDCRARVLPSSLVNETKLRSILTNLTESGYPQLGLRPAVPTQFLSRYFSLPLTDCTHTDDVFVVRLLVPVLKGQSGHSRSWSLRVIRSVPFLLNSKICRLRDMKDQATFLFDPINLVAYETECRSSEPCDISYSRLSSKIHLCASMIFSHKVDRVIEHCDFDCVDFIRPPFPGLLTLQVDSGTFVLTGRDPLQLICRLNREESETIDIDLSVVEVGAFELVLNCDCQLSLKGGQISVVQSGVLMPCERVHPFYQIFQVVPWHFLRTEKKVEIHDEIVEKFNSINSTFDEEPIQVELFNENVETFLDMDFMNLLTSDTRDKHPAVVTRLRVDSLDEGGGSKFNWLFIPLLVLVGVLCVGQILLFYQMNKVRGHSYYSFHNSVLYKSTTTPSLITQEND